MSVQRVIWARAGIERVWRMGEVNLKWDNTPTIPSLPSGYPSF